MVERFRRGGRREKIRTLGWLGRPGDRFRGSRFHLFVVWGVYVVVFSQPPPPPPKNYRWHKATGGGGMLFELKKKRHLFGIMS